MSTAGNGWCINLSTTPTRAKNLQTDVLTVHYPLCFVNIFVLNSWFLFYYFDRFNGHLSITATVTHLQDGHCREVRLHLKLLFSVQKQNEIRNKTFRNRTMKLQSVHYQLLAAKSSTEMDRPKLLH